MDPRTFLYGCIAGIVMVIGSFVLVCEVADVRWEPVQRCKIIDGHEIVTGHCIPYCPPDPKECG